VQKILASKLEFSAWGSWSPDITYSLSRFLD